MKNRLNITFPTIPALTRRFCRTVSLFNIQFSYIKYWQFCLLKQPFKQRVVSPAKKMFLMNSRLFLHHSIIKQNSNLRSKSSWTIRNLQECHLFLLEYLIPNDRLTSFFVAVCLIEVADSSSLAILNIYVKLLEVGQEK